MTRTRKPKTAGSLSASAILATCAALASSAALAQSKPSVTVVNPVSNPVNTRITNAVVPVEISNADAIAVTAQDSEGNRQIYRKTVTVKFGNSAGDCNFTDLVTVPAGKRLVIEYLSATSSFEIPIRLIAVSLRVPSGKLVAVAPATANDFDNLYSYSAAGQYVHAYTDTSLWACANVNGASTQDLEVNVTGYLVDKP